jgi:hypothetical protein
MSRSAAVSYVALLAALGAVLILFRTFAHKALDNRWARRLGSLPTSGLPKANVKRYSERALTCERSARVI